LPRGVRVAVFTPNPFCAIYFLSTAAKSKQKGPLGKLYSSSNYLVNKNARGRARASALPINALVASPMARKISYLGCVVN